jgi:RND family efflux transporter MFP subunit
MFRSRIAWAFLAASLVTQASAQAPASVTASPLGELLIESPSQAPASVDSLNAATLSAEVTAVITAFEVPPQARVAAGDLLVRLDDTDHRLALQQSEAMLGAVRARVELFSGRLERARRLVADGFVSVDDVAALETELAVARAEVRVQEAALAIARRALDKTRVRAPFDGQTGVRFGASGQLVMPGAPLLAIVDLASIELRAELPAAEADTLGSGSQLRFETQGRDYAVELLRISDIIDSGTRTREARLRFVDDVPAVGSQGRLIWRRPGGLLPGHLLVRRDGRLGVFLAEDGRARFHALDSAQEGRAAMVDLPATAMIVVDGREALNDGDRLSLR